MDHIKKAAVRQTFPCPVCKGEARDCAARCRDGIDWSAAFDAQMKTIETLVAENKKLKQQILNDERYFAIEAQKKKDQE